MKNPEGQFWWKSYEIPESISDEVCSWILKMFLEDLAPSWEISKRIFEQIPDGFTEVNPVAILVEIQVRVILGEIPCEIITKWTL